MTLAAVIFDRGCEAPFWISSTHVSHVTVTHPPHMPAQPHTDNVSAILGTSRRDE